MTLPPQNLPRYTPPELIAEVCRLARETEMSQREIGLHLGIFKSKVHDILTRAGVKTRNWDRRQHRAHGELEPVKITLPRVRCLETIDE